MEKLSYIEQWRLQLFDCDDSQRFPFVFRHYTRLTATRCDNVQWICHLHIQQAMGIIVIVLTTLIFVKLRATQRKLQPIRVLIWREKKLEQVNCNLSSSCKRAQ
ncbi:hypothetical protein KIN20_019574 [Parelaphostrongylus tenuis]|uniref:Uncharacterized protein n=1 Tax=Parelaphostrongylus tenuis TaxID=148309 RepID=A0AAD5N395_PARTN|nr:hypothetical protein KIN20_019574 [Parelaphostrongylus tenuis]